MSQADLNRAMLVIGLFGVAGVALILYQHSLHTGQIVAALGSSAPADAANASAFATSPASLAGTPTPGQLNLLPPPPAPALLVAGPGWSVSGG